MVCLRRGGLSARAKLALKLTDIHAQNETVTWNPPIAQQVSYKKSPPYKVYGGMIVETCLLRSGAKSLKMQPIHWYVHPGFTKGTPRLVKNQHK